MRERLKLAFKLGLFSASRVLNTNNCILNVGTTFKSTFLWLTVHVKIIFVFKLAKERDAADNYVMRRFKIRTFQQILLES